MVHRVTYGRSVSYRVIHAVPGTHEKLFLTMLRAISIQLTKKSMKKRSCKKKNLCLLCSP